MFNLVYEMLMSLVGWFIFVPLGFLIPKKKNQIVFFSGYNGQFTGNIKHLYIMAQNSAEWSDAKMHILTQDKQTYDLLKARQQPVVFFPSIKGVRLLLTTPVAVVDHMEWIHHGKFHLLFFAKKIQIWHGVGFKRIELMNMDSVLFKNRNGFVKFLIHGFRIIKGRYPKYEMVVSTSDFYSKNVFSKAFHTKKVFISGYPRNDIFFSSFDRKWKLNRLNSDEACMETVRNHRNIGKKVLVYMPTFRDTGGSIFSSNAWDYDAFNTFCRRNNYIMVVKNHPHPDHEKVVLNYDNIINFDTECDIYPLLRHSDLLITDYSSVYMDYLLLNKPVIFYPYDMDEYVSKNRDIQFDYEWITPGPICLSQTEVQHQIHHILTDKCDVHRNKRDEIKTMAFAHHDGQSSKRILNEIQKIYPTNKQIRP